MLRKLLSLFVIILPISSPLLAWSQEPISTPADFVLFQDFETGKVLYSKNPDKRMYPASMTKIMTAYVVFEELKANRISLTDTFTISKRAHSIGGSRMFLEIGQKVSVEDLLRGIIVQSGNDASVAVAENIGGSEIGFASIMNDVAKKLGMNDSNFVNASGWPDEDHYTTAQDLLLLTEATIKNFPEYYNYYAETDFTYADIKQGNRNPLLNSGLGADGLKTGHTEASGYGLVASARAHDRRLILIINGLNSKAQRASESERLMEWGLRNFDNYRLLLNGDEVGHGPVQLGSEKSVPLVVKEDITLTLPKTDRRALEVVLAYDSPIRAPIKEGDIIGNLEISARGKLIDSYPIYAGQSVRGLSFFGRIKNHFDDLLGR